MTFKEAWEPHKEQNITRVSDRKRTFLSTKDFLMESTVRSWLRLGSSLSQALEIHH